MGLDPGLGRGLPDDLWQIGAPPIPHVRYDPVLAGGQTGKEITPGAAFSYSWARRASSRGVRRPRYVSRTTRWWMTWSSAQRLEAGSGQHSQRPAPIAGVLLTTNEAAILKVDHHPSDAAGAHHSSCTEVGHAEFQVRGTDQGDQHAVVAQGELSRLPQAPVDLTHRGLP